MREDPHDDFTEERAESVRGIHSPLYKAVGSRPVPFFDGLWRGVGLVEFDAYDEGDIEG